MASVSPTFARRPYAKRLASAVGIDEFDGHELIVEDGVRGSDAEGVFENGLDRPPDVDDLESAFEQRVDFLWEVERHAVGRSGVGLVDVDALD